MKRVKRDDDQGLKRTDLTSTRVAEGEFKCHENVFTSIIGPWPGKKLRLYMGL
jgi:hypothetical protein